MEELEALDVWTTPIGGSFNNVDGVVFSGFLSGNFIYGLLAL
jgi:hypothetical protein